MQLVSLLVTQFCCDTSCKEIARCNMPRDHKVTQHFSCKASHQVESGSTFRNDCRNAAIHFPAIAQRKIPFATCLAIFLSSSKNRFQLLLRLRDNLQEKMHSETSLTMKLQFLKYVCCETGSVALCNSALRIEGFAKIKMLRA